MPFSSCILLPLSVLALLLLPLPTTPISFDYPKFDSTIRSGACSPGKKQICLVGDAAVDSRSHIQLTRNEKNTNSTDSIGRAYYSEVLHLWDNVTGELLVTNFTSHFTFNISKYSQETIGADGFAFFLSPAALIQSEAGGGNLGLVHWRRHFNASGNISFVAVEFDTYKNPDWDLLGRHVGIDVNSIRSVQNVSVDDSTSQFSGEAEVVYNSVTNILSVSLDYNNSTYALSHVLDLSTVLPQFVYFGFTGATGLSSQMNTITSWSFSSSLDGILDARQKSKATNNTFNPVENKNDKDTKKMPVAIIVVIGLLLAAVAVAVALLILWGYRRRVQRSETEEDEMGLRASIDEVELGYKGGPRKFALHDLLHATDNFKDENKLGSGGSGTVYRGYIKDLKCHAAIKRVSNRDIEQSKKEYVAEIKVISQLRHRNLVQFMGWCHEKGQLLLVYELMPNCSLDRHLFNAGKVLPWSLRYNAALGVASALLYLHEEWQECIVHRDVKCSNIMVDEDFTAKLGDFGLARLTKHGSGLQTTMFGGTMGYIAPECFFTGKASRESDVYALGIVALELATGRRPVESTGKDDVVKLVEWVWDRLDREQLLEAADTNLGGDFDSCQMERLLIVGLWCAHPDMNCRPSIRKAVAALNLEDVKIDLPRKMPVPMYATALPIHLSQSTISSGVSASSAATTSSGGGTSMASVSLSR